MDAAMSGGQPDFEELMRRWDEQQCGYLPRREERFAVMLELLHHCLPEDLVALDLGCGPGSLSKRLLERFPRARCIAIDYDPVLLAIGRAHLGDVSGRLRFIEADLRVVELTSELAGERIDAVLSTTALHWLPAPRLKELYRQLGRLLRPHGLFLNGDNIPFGADFPTLTRVSAACRAEDERRAFRLAGVEDWERFWAGMAEEPQLVALMAERERRLSAWPRDHDEPTLAVHEQALREAGFGEVGVAWQYLDDRVHFARLGT